MVETSPRVAPPAAGSAHPSVVDLTLATRAEWLRPGPFVGYVEALLSVSVGLILADTARRWFDLTDVALILLLSVLFPAIRSGIWPAILGAVVAFLGYNFFFITPLYTLTVSQPREFLALVAFLIVAIITAALAGQSRERARVAMARERTIERLYAFTRRLSYSANRSEVAEAVAGEVRGLTARRCALLLGEGDRLALAALAPRGTELDDTALSAAEWAFGCKEVAGAGSPFFGDCAWTFLPLTIGRRPVGALGVEIGDAGQLLDGDEQVLLHALAEQAASAIDRASLAKEADTARAEAETERVRNTLLASISHDFRTPLASILGASTSLIDFGERLRPEQRVDLLSSIREEGERLDGMVRNLLSMTRLEAGALDIRRDWVDIGEIADRLADQARRRGMAGRLTLSVPSGLPLVKADASLIEQALSNVVANAARHGGPKVKITLNAEEDGGWLRLAVEDDGPGISPDILPRVFDKFVRGARHTGDGGDGSGLGLAITQGIVALHGGTATAESPIENGHGTRITLSLPIEEPS
ncbi:ATP-binding protein [Pleomorphomonas oryzae]|uniref:ATP-binding protein n=1 Tax=Pleomorphomonas oryzae TaxID=261934 RepID=UPI00040A47EE|nr:ATP-binding protein [Pleomorphomonas oryzae]